MYRGKRIYLAPLMRADRAILLEWINDCETSHFNGSYKPVSEVEQEAWFEAVLRDKQTTIFAIRACDDGRLIGTTQLTHINLLHRRAELRIRIGDDAERSKGFGFEALTLLLEYAKRDLNLRKVYLFVLGDNARALALYRKLGFSQEGILKAHSFINGAYKDEIVMGKFLD